MAPEHKLKRKRKGADPWTKRKRSKPVVPRPPPKALTCRICAEEKEPTEFLRWVTPRMRLNEPTRIPYACVKHLCRNPRTRNDPVCKSCIGATMAAAVDNGLAERLSHGCLEVGCTTTWDLNFILAFMPTEKVEEYNQQMFQVYLHEAKTFTCPLPSCGATGLLDRFHTPGFPHVECNACETRICALCAVPWHQGLSCQAYRAANASSLMNAEEKKTLRELQKRGAKRCPRCQLAIEKDGGCDHMYCQHCGKYFAWSSAEAVVGISKAKTKAKGKENENSAPMMNPYSEICEIDAANAPPPPYPLMFAAPRAPNPLLPPPPPPALFTGRVPPEIA